ncbi:translation elongation factor Ts [Funiculus sociatus GB2-A5]|jgi:elongation factor Ts|uniref:Elongation factor Ts n=1 Tax=Funiculus sociatus GB2-A5 TaxID=2933946 RepID=A0ABV0JSD7_9CYAN|nr:MULTISPECIES: translation elongation factor Ts [unclassified Trichocoleus]MBD1908920.1 elongation factor Ts [Trichocoleus sp. FACHB-832]MBD2002437.1 elongation factor Ts [Trichocoleus sp. FACHB-40]MBD2064569.1 elongation factor Ts [Trichocoleus sp. FACHB-6]
MAEISAKVVQELRQKTGVGMMDCKKALKETDGDMDKAIEWLRQKNMIKAGKMETRAATDGLIGSYIGTAGRVGVLVEVNCQTDFVARNEAFKTLVQNIAMQAADASDVNSLMSQPYIHDQNITVEELVKQNISQLGENIQVRRFERFVLDEGTSGLVGSYIHTGGRVGVLVEVNCQSDEVAASEEFKTLVQNVAMQIAACPNVEYVKVSDIPAEVVEREKGIEMGRDDLGNKPQNIKEKIVQGRIDKRLQEMTLMDQPYIRDQSIAVEDLVKQHVSQLGGNIEVRQFVRYILGEGLEKQESNFAEEVAAQMGGNK